MPDGCEPPSDYYGWLVTHRGDLDGMWKPISLMTVEYPSSDLIGKLCAWSGLIPQFLVVAFITLILFRRELHTIGYFLGILLNEIVNHLLKHTFRQSRPCRVWGGNLHEKFGMPSSHSQFMAFFATYITFFTYIRLRYPRSEKYNEDVISGLVKNLLVLSSLTVTLFVAYGRVYLYYHTVDQVLAGLLVGCITGTIWFLIMHLLLTPLFPTIANTKLAELLLVRDSTNIPNILWFEYTSSRIETRQRQRRNTHQKIQ